VDPEAHKAAMERLEPLVGEWSLDASFPGVPPTGPVGRTAFEWTLNGQFLIQRSEIPHPAAPVGFCIVGFDLEAKKYVQHYFDSRGVARVYAMTFDDGVWERRRESKDFSPLDFFQRFIGTFSADGETIEGAWETSKDGSTWERDFGLTYRRIGS
jgi:hypothetical protein